MADLYTACYSSFHPSMGQPVIISLTTPRWLDQEWPRFWLATPRWKYMKSGSDYPVHFFGQLDRYGVKKVTYVLEKIAAETEAESLVLLCHEGDWTYCHRRMFANWMLKRSGVLIQELGGWHHVDLPKERPPALPYSVNEAL